jgi:hypothetical protein
MKESWAFGTEYESAESFRGFIKLSRQGNFHSLRAILEKEQL